VFILRAKRPSFTSAAIPGPTRLAHGRIIFRRTFFSFATLVGQLEFKKSTIISSFGANDRHTFLPSRASKVTVAATLLKWQVTPSFGLCTIILQHICFVRVYGLLNVHS
jgi:hypothetical protein